MRELDGRDVITCAAVTAAVVAGLEWLVRTTTHSVMPGAEAERALGVLFEWALLLGAVAYVSRHFFQQVKQEPGLLWRAFLPVAVVAGAVGALSAYPELADKLTKPDAANEAWPVLATQAGLRTVLFLAAITAGTGWLRLYAPETETWGFGGSLEIMADTLGEKAEGFCQRAREYYEQGNLGLAETEYRKALRVDPDLAEARLGLGYVSIYLRKHGVAEDQFNRLSHLEGHLGDAHAGLGYMYMERRQLAQAREHFDAALKADSYCVKALCGLGAFYLMQGEYEHARPEFERAVRLEPDDENARDGLGAAYLGLERYQEAIEEFDRALELRPDFQDVYYRRGLAYRGLGEEEQARRDWDTALRLAPHGWYAEEIRQQQRRDAGLSTVARRAEVEGERRETTND